MTPSRSSNDARSESRNWAVRLLPATVTKLIGGVFGLLVGAAFLKRWRFRAVDVFFLAYAGILSLWPFYDPRFWIPILPLAFGAVWSVIMTVRVRAVRAAVAAYLLIFAASGVSSLAYSIHMSLVSATRFAETFGGGSMRNTYCVGLAACEVDASRGPVDTRAVEVLRSYK
jgi:hypothetical protein